MLRLLRPSLDATAADPHFKFADTADTASDHIAHIERSDPWRRAGHDQIAGAQADRMRKLADDLAHRPDLAFKVRALTLHTVDGQPDGALSWMAMAAGGQDRGHRRRAVEGLGRLPGVTHRFGGHLQITPGQVQSCGG